MERQISPGPDRPRPQRRAPIAQSLCAVAMLFCVSAAPVDAGQSGAASNASQRLVTIGGSVTEIVHALGFGASIVALDTTSRYPPQLFARKAKVGYMRALSAEGVLSAGGTMILASEGAGPPGAIAALKASSTPLVTIPDEPSARGIASKIEAIGRALGATAKARALASKVERQLDALAALRGRIAKPRTVLFVLAMRGSRIIVGGRDTSADAIIHLAGAKNAAATVNGYKPIVAEALLKMAPGAILVMKRTSSNHNTDALRSLPVLKLIPAGRDGRIREIDGLYLLGFGPRTPVAARDVMQWLYPGLDQG